LSGSRLAVAFNPVRIYCSFCISSVRMYTDEDKNATGSKNLLLKKAQNKTFLFVERRFLIRTRRHIHQAEDIINIMTPSSDKEMTVPSML
jgi:hypothetical protein